MSQFKKYLEIIQEADKTILNETEFLKKFPEAFKNVFSKLKGNTQWIGPVGSKTKSETLDNKYQSSVNAINVDRVNTYGTYSVISQKLNSEDMEKVTTNIFNDEDNKNITFLINATIDSLTDKSPNAKTTYKQYVNKNEKEIIEMMKEALNSKN